MSATAPSVLTIDLDAITRNFAKLRALVLPPCKISAVVKANAYGLGIAEIAPVLESAGATNFFVATIDEALELRKITDKKIATLNGYFRGAEKEYEEHDIIPVLCSLEEIERWNCGPKPCAWQIDTGMNRLGLRPEEFDKAYQRCHLQPGLVMSHLACADDPGHSKNLEQLQKFQPIVEKHPLLRFSLANSSGIFLGAEYHFNLVRPGMGLYGLNPTPEIENPMDPVVHLETRILQIRKAYKGETAGYGASHKFTTDTKLAIVSLGYADGFLRSGSNQAHLYWQAYPCPVVGRVSMDLMIVSLNNLPANCIPPYEGDSLEVIGPSQSADNLAADLGTIGYEVLTSLGSRSHRIYKTAKAG